MKRSNAHAPMRTCRPRLASPSCAHASALIHARAHAQLIEMGFPRAACLDALHKSRFDVGAAAELLMR